MTPGPTSISKSCSISIGIFAWNEERAIAATLESLFQQTLFTELSRVGWAAEVVCVTNGCTDRTPELAEDIFARDLRRPHFAGCVQGRVARIERPGKINAWNEFVHSFSARSAAYLFMMDADIWIHCRETLWNMVRALEERPEASVAVDRPRKDIHFKQRKAILDTLSVGASRITLTSEAQLCGQLYCLRAPVARGIYLPRELAACEDGILKALVCTDNLAHEVWPQRICVAERAEHTFEAYTSPGAIIRNQKRQIIGQTMVHILIDKEFPSMIELERQNLQAIVRRRDASDPGWLKRAVGAHLQRTRLFWRLYPSLLTQPFRSWLAADARDRIWLLPAALARWVATLVSSWLAYRTLRAGCIAYWPKAKRRGACRPGKTALDDSLTPSEAVGAD